MVWKGLILLGSFNVTSLGNCKFKIAWNLLLEIHFIMIVWGKFKLFTSTSQNLSKKITEMEEEDSTLLEVQIHYYCL